MNNHVRDYVLKHKDKLTGRVLEVGSQDVNGSVRDIVPNAIGIDMQAGRNVDIVCRSEDLLEHFEPESFDAVMSFDALEHIEDWRGTIEAMWSVLKPGGWMVMTMASPSKGRHGYPNDYWRANWEHISSIFPDADDMGSWGPSMGWVVQKTRPLPNLAEIELMKV